MLFLLLIFQATDTEIEFFEFMLKLFGIVLLIIILAYVLLTSKQE